MPRDVPSQQELQATPKLDVDELAAGRVARGAHEHDAGCDSVVAVVEERSEQRQRFGGEADRLFLRDEEARVVVTPIFIS